MLADWKASGLTSAEFSRQRNISRPLLFVWQRRLGLAPGRRRSKVLPKRPSFLPVRILDNAIPSDHRSIELTLRNGRQLRVSADMAPPVLAELAAALEGATC
jgi:hypothetical protein